MHECVYIYSDSGKAFGQVCVQTSSPLSAFEGLQFSLWAVTFKEANRGAKKNLQNFISQAEVHYSLGKFLMGSFKKCCQKSNLTNKDMIVVAKVPPNNTHVQHIHILGPKGVCMLIILCIISFTRGTSCICVQPGKKSYAKLSKGTSSDYHKVKAVKPAKPRLILLYKGIAS